MGFFTKCRIIGVIGFWLVMSAIAYPICMSQLGENGEAIWLLGVITVFCGGLNIGPRWPVI